MSKTSKTQIDALRNAERAIREVINREAAPSGAVIDRLATTIALDICKRIEGDVVEGELEKLIDEQWPLLVHRMSISRRLRLALSILPRLAEFAAEPGDVVSADGEKTYAAIAPDGIEVVIDSVGWVCLAILSGEQAITLTPAQAFILWKNLTRFVIANDRPEEHGGGIIGEFPDVKELLFDYLHDTTDGERDLIDLARSNARAAGYQDGVSAIKEELELLIEAATASTPAERSAILATPAVLRLVEAHARERKRSA